MFGVGLATLWLSLLVFIPLGAVVWRSQKNGFGSFWGAATTPFSGSKNSVMTLSQPPRSSMVNRPVGVGKTVDDVPGTTGRKPFSEKIFCAVAE